MYNCVGDGVLDVSKHPENRVGADIIRPCHSELVEESLYYRFVKSISFSIFLITSIYGCYVTFGVKSNQKRGGCDSPAPHKRRTSVECSVCYKSGKITNLRHYVPSHCNFSSIYTSISPPVSIAVLCLPWLSACSPQTSLLLFGESVSPNPFLFAKFQFI